MSEAPRCLVSEADFPHREELAAAIANGSSIRKDVRALSAENLLGTYAIRLKIAQDHGNAEQISDLAFLVSKLQSRANRGAEAWYIHSVDGTRFQVFECSDSGDALGCLKGDIEIAQSR
jgi:hypothetical protein